MEAYTMCVQFFTYLHVQFLLTSAPDGECSEEEYREHDHEYPANFHR